MPVLRILLLGSPAMFWDDQPLQVQRRTLRTLLYYLAAHPEPVARAELLTLLWPDENEGDARRHLRETLSKLRADLPDPGILVKEQDSIGLDHSRIYCDMLEFESLVEQTGQRPWQLPASQPLPEVIHQILRKALRLWRTSHFMAGANLPPSPALDSWLMLTSQSLEHVRERILLRLADHASASGEPEVSLHWLRLAIENEELNEDLHYRVMKLLADLGRRTEALKYYTYLQDLFQRELNGLPSPAIQGLYEKILRESLAPSVPGERFGWPVAMSMQVPFVGQGLAITLLKQAIRRGGVSLVSGEVGAGKTRLVQEAFQSIEASPRLLLAPARSLEKDLPFQPLVDLLRHSLNVEDWNRVGPVWVGEISALLPELVVVRPGAPPPDKIRALPSPGVLFEAVRQSLLQAARSQPVLLVLENAQWADESTFACLAYLIERHFFQLFGSLVVTYRPEEKNPALAAWISSLQRPFTEIHLAPLHEKEIQDLASSALGAAPAPNWVSYLTEISGGNPLFLLETLRSMIEQVPDWSALQFPTSLPVAGSLVGMVHNRTSQLSAPGRQVLGVAALVGKYFDSRLVEQAAHLDSDVYIRAMEEVEAAHWVEPAIEHGAASYRFIHGVVPRVLALEMSPVRRRVLHLRLAQALESQVGRSAASQSLEIAKHYTLAGEYSSAFPQYIQAGQTAERMEDFPAMLAAYRQAEQLVDQISIQCNDEELLKFFRSYVQAARRCGDFDLAAQGIYHLQALGEQRHSETLLAAADALTGEL